VEELGLAYGAMDVFASLSLSENLPLTLIEAAFAGVPAIGLDRGGTAEIIKHGETGFVLRDPNEFCSALLKCISDPCLLKSMSENSKIHADNQFSITSVANKYRDVYFSLTDSK
jgi:glycosyltransferase involved in cell wall biosynthesis